MFNLLLCNLDTFNLNEGTNRQKRELFVVAVRSASGDTLPVNLTIIPSAQKWVFNAIYQLAFPSLYSSNVCSMNRLVLTDEDEAEYAPFQSAIATMPEFSKSNVMLCTFHGIWQSFKKDLYPLLDANPHGQLLGMLMQYFLAHQNRYVHFHVLNFTLFKFINFDINSGVAIPGIHKPSMCL